MLKSDNKKVQIIGFYALVLFLLSMLINVRVLDETFKLYSSLSMANGLKIYKDINIIVPPFTFIISSFFVKLYGGIITIKILNVLMWTLMAFLVHKIMDKYNVKRYLIMLAMFIVVLLLFFISGFYYDYNTLALLLFIGELYIILNKKADNKYSFALGIIAGLIIWTKHSLIVLAISGIIAFIFYNYKSKIIKKLLFILLGTIFTSTLFVTYITYLGVWKDFYNLLFCGMKNFANESKEKTIITMIIILLSLSYFIIRTFIFLRNKSLKEIISKNKDTLVLAWFGASTTVFCLPSFDIQHFQGTLLFILLFEIYIGNEKKTKWINRLLIIGIITLCSVAALKVTFYKNRMTIADENVFKYQLIEKDYNDVIKEASDIISKADKKVYVLEKDACNIALITGNRNGYYDFLWNGNTGKTETIELVKKLDKKDCYVLIRKQNKKVTWWNPNIRKYIVKNYKVVNQNKYWLLYMKK